MSRRRDRATGDLFEVPEPAEPRPYSMSYSAEIAELVSAILDQSPDDHWQIAASMSRLCGREVSKYMLDAWSSPARETFNIPLYLVPVLEQAASTHELTAWLCQVRGAKPLFGRDALHPELGRLQRVQDEARRQANEIRKSLGEDT